MEKTEGLDQVVSAEVLIEARPETVFGIMSSAEGMSAWLDGEATFEPVVGAGLTLRFPRFHTTVTGEVLAVEENRLLSVSWGVAEGPQAEWLPAGSTRVTFRLEPEAGGTRVHVTHESLPTEQEIANHRAGWRFHLSRLELISNRAQLEDELPAVMDCYYDAWNTEDEADRAALFADTCAEDFEFADEYASLTGLEPLSLHAGNTRKYIPGTRIRRSGPPLVCRGEALVPWEVVDVDGGVVFDGTDHVRVGADGRISRITGFWRTHPTL